MNDLMHYGTKGMKWGQRKEYESHSKKRTSNNDLKKEKRKKRLIKAAIILGSSSAAIGGLIALSKFKKKRKEKFLNLEKTIRTLNAENEMDEFIKAIPKAKTNEIWKEQNNVIKQVWNKKLSNIDNDVSKLKFNKSRYKTLKRWNKNRENITKFLRNKGLS